MTNNNEEFAVIGHGSFGSVWSSDIEDNPESNLSSVIDTDPIDSDDVPGSPTIKQEDYTEAVDLYHDEAGDLDYEVTDEDLLENLSSIDQAVVSTDTDAHFEVGLALAEAEVDMMLEKPPTESPEETELLLEAVNENDVETGVNMIERQHPAYRAAQEVFGDEDIKRMFNYRSKDLRGNERGQGGGEGSRIIMEDLIHDLSEIEGLTDSQLRNSVVENAEIERWSEVGDFPYNTDVNAEASIQYDDGTEVDMKGSFADEERRYFIAVNEEENKAVYVNTLSSDHISPQAAVVEGQEDVEYLEIVAREGLIVDEESQRVLLDVLDADSLEDEMEEHVPDAKYDGDEPQFAYAPVYNQVKQMTSGEEPLSSLEEVLGYQETMEEIYKESGELDAATPNW